MAEKIRKILPILAFSLIPTLLVWLPFFLRFKSFWGIPLPPAGMATIVANYDGPLFIVVAKTFYNPDLIKNFSFPLPVEYYAAHFPLFPLLISIFSRLMGYPYAMLTVTVLSSMLAIYFFRRLIEDHVDQKHLLFLTLTFSIFPARWLIVRSVGSAEPLFLACVTASVYYFQKKDYLKAGIWGALAQATKSAGILLFIAFVFALILPHLKRAVVEPFHNWAKNLELNKIYPIFLIPLSLLAVFAIYKVKLNDFLAYFHSGDNVHLFFPPFQIFNYSAPWVGTFWLEEIIFVYLFGMIGLLRLIEQKRLTIAWFVGVFFFSTIFVSHRDLIRYFLPIVPFLFLAYSEILTRSSSRWVILFLTIPIYLFSLSFISQNVMPISDWAPFL